MFFSIPTQCTVPTQQKKMPRQQVDPSWFTQITLRSIKMGGYLHYLISFRSIQNDKKSTEPWNMEVSL